MARLLLGSRNMRFYTPLTYFPEPELQSIEIASSFQIPSFQIVGLPGPEVNESRERVRAAIEASQLRFPRRRIVINLAPASIRKRGTGADLAMALAVLAHQVLDDRDRTVAAWAELGLSGATKPGPHPLRALYAAARAGAPWFLHAAEDSEALEEAAALLRDAGLHSPARVPLRNLSEAWDWVRAAGPAPGVRSEAPRLQTEKPATDELPVPSALVDALGLALSGFHSLLLLGPRGAGKTLALNQAVACFPGLSPSAKLLQRMNRELDAAASSTAASAVRVGPEVRPAGLLGGWSEGQFRPGALARAHESLLLADEFPEWSRDSRETLRGPMDQGFYTIQRKEGSCEVRSRFLLLASGNLCPCGGVPEKMKTEEEPSLQPACRCSLPRREAYLSRLSGPILDRIDLAQWVVSRATKAGAAKPVTELRDRIQECRDRLIRRWEASPGLLNPRQLETILSESPSLRRALGALSHPSLRSRHKALRLALTLSSWSGEAPEDCLWRAEQMRPEKILGS